MAVFVALAAQAALGTMSLTPSDFFIEARSQAWVAILLTVWWSVGRSDYHHPTVKQGSEQSLQNHGISNVGHLSGQREEGEGIQTLLY